LWCRNMYERFKMECSKGATQCFSKINVLGKYSKCGVNKKFIYSAALI